MNSLSNILNTLGEQVVPMIASNVFPDEMDILRDVTVSDGGGGVKRSYVPAVNLTPIPCTYEPFTDNAFKAVNGEAMTSRVKYKITFPTNHEGSRVEIKPSDRIKVSARGTQQSKTFRTIGIKNDSGVVFEVIAELVDEV